MKKIFFLLSILCYLYIVPILSSVHADYVLPYPSYMPGNKIYTLSRVFDRLNNWWYFGSIAQTKYHLKLSDKYLVESKTLFEYQQYLLALDALNRSDSEFSQIPVYVQKAVQEGKDIVSLSDTVRLAALKHTEVLVSISGVVPESFLWMPEKSDPTRLDLLSHILEAKNIRERTLQELSGKENK